MSRNRLLLIAAGLAVSAITCLALGIWLDHKDIRSYVASHYTEYSHDASGKRYVCTGPPAQVADTLAGYKRPEARAANGGTQYLRYSNAIVLVGPDGNHSCSIRVEDLGARFSNGGFIFLGPGFTPGSPAGGGGGSPGGPGGSK